MNPAFGRRGDRVEPRSAPVGTMICPPRALASSTNSGRGNSAPAESTITCFPASSMGRQIRSSTDAGAHSIARSPGWEMPRARPTGRQSARHRARPAPWQYLAPPRRRASTPVCHRPACGEHAADRAEAGNGDADHGHGRTFTSRTSDCGACVIPGAVFAHKRGNPASNSDLTLVRRRASVSQMAGR